MATIRDVAQLSGVSVSTVSRVLNKSGYVNQETEHKVNLAIQTLQYEPSAVARGLASKRSRTIALILSNMMNPFFPELARAVEEVARTFGYTVFFGSSDDQADKEQAYIEIFRQRYVDGIIFSSHTLGMDEALRLNSSHIPYIVLDRAPSDEVCSVVRSNNRAGARLAVQHLLDRGCSKIAHICGPQGIRTAQERLRGYEDIVKHLPWYSPSLLIPGNFLLDGGITAAEQMMERHPDVDGVFVGNDLMAVGVLKSLLRMGIQVPEQVAICGFDGIQLTEATEPEITTVAQPIYELGALATRLLIQKINGEAVANSLHELDVTLIPRASTRKD